MRAKTLILGLLGGAAGWLLLAAIGCASMRAANSGELQQQIAGVAASVRELSGVKGDVSGLRTDFGWAALAAVIGAPAVALVIVLHFARSVIGHKQTSERLSRVEKIVKNGVEQ